MSLQPNPATSLRKCGRGSQGLEEPADFVGAALLALTETLRPRGASVKIEYFHPSVIFSQPFLIVMRSFLGSLVAFLILGYFLGKRF